MFSFFGFTGMHKGWQPAKPTHTVRPETKRINGDNTAIFAQEQPKT